MISSVPPEDAPEANALSSVARNLGGSLGLAGLASFQAQRMDVHYWQIHASLSANDPALQDSLTQSGSMFGVGPEAADAALRMLDGEVMRQSLVMSFNDIYLAFAVIGFSLIPLVLLLRPPPKGARHGSDALSANPARGRPPAGQAELITARLIDAAWQVLLENGPEQLSLDRVAAAAHASKQTIYTRFAGKRELLQAVLEARIGRIFGEFQQAAGAGELEAVIADVTRRSVSALSAPESLMLDRLADWIDAAQQGNPTRAAIYAEFHRLLRGYLRGVAGLASLADGEIADAATLWLDSLIGHVRGVPRGGAELDRWSRHVRALLHAGDSCLGESPGVTGGACGLGLAARGVDPLHPVGQFLAQSSNRTSLAVIHGSACGAPRAKAWKRWPNCMRRRPPVSIQLCRPGSRAETTKVKSPSSSARHLHHVEAGGALPVFDRQVERVGQHEVAESGARGVRADEQRIRLAEVEIALAAPLRRHAAVGARALRLAQVVGRFPVARMGDEE